MESTRRCKSEFLEDGKEHILFGGRLIQAVRERQVIDDASGKSTVEGWRVLVEEELEE